MLYVYGMSGRMPLSGQESGSLVQPPRAVQRGRFVNPVAKDVDEPVGGATRPAVLAAAAYGEARTESSRQHHRIHHVREVMVRPALTVPVAAALPLAWSLFERHGVGQLVVVDAGGVLVGQLARDDLLGPAWPSLIGRPTGDATLSSAWTPERLQWAARIALDAWLARRLSTVGDLMRSPTPAASPDSDLRRVAAVLIGTGLSGLPVADDRGVPVGWVGRRELLGAVAAEPPVDLWG